MHRISLVLDAPDGVLRLDAATAAPFVVRPGQERRCLGEISTDSQLRH